jgi:hypothetical protein
MTFYYRADLALVFCFFSPLPYPSNIGFLPPQSEVVEKTLRKAGCQRGEGGRGEGGRVEGGRGERGTVRGEGALHGGWMRGLWVATCCVTPSSNTVISCKPVFLSVKHGWYSPLLSHENEVR